MNSYESTFQRNFTITVIFHVLAIGGLVLFERYASSRNDNTPTIVELITPPPLQGDLPVGPGKGTGAFRQPPPDAGQQEPVTSGATGSSSPDDDRPAPVPPVPHPIPVPQTEAGVVHIPRNTNTRPVPVQARQNPVATAPTATNHTRPTTGTTRVAGTARPTGRPGPSVADFRARFLKNLQAGGGDGSPLGDNRPAGGGDGTRRYGRLGHPDGAENGMVGGTGPGSPFWDYYLHVHDQMYEAWEQPPDVNDRKLVAVVLLKIARDGSITKVELESSSGNQSMDKSALAAARKVARLEPPPAALVKGSSANITVNFQLKG